jgi:peptidoglycan hydrolase-like protein with peptidoglycan-binding domain
VARGRNGDPAQGPVAASFAGRLAERAIENPAATGGLLVMALTASAIVVNATYLQPTDYPRPHLAPRAPVTPATPIPTPRPRDTVGAIPPASGVSAPARASAVPGPKEPAAKPTEADPGLVTDTQHELARLGLYSGAIDGIVGARTRAAIAGYQSAIGLPASGVPSPGLLGLIRQNATPKTAATSIRATASPLPPAAVPGAAASGAPAKPVPITAVIDADAAAAATYRRVQLALNQIGYGAIPVDGKPGKETADAIRRFELDYGLQVTGQPNEAVLKRLVAIGALPAR